MSLRGAGDGIARGHPAGTLELVTDVRPEPAALAWDQESGGVEWHVELDRAVLLPTARGVRGLGRTRTRRCN